MMWPDEIRTPDFGFLDEDISVRPPELAMAGSLIDSMAGEFDPDEYTDNYRAALQEVIDAKVEGREIVSPEEPEAAPTAAVDLMAALKASVERARAARGEQAGSGDAAGAGATPISAAKSAKKATPADKSPAEKPSTKKPPAKKATPAKQAAEKSTAAKRTTGKKAEPTKKARKSA
jgi:DNA end-binding protein Ku